MVLKYIKPYNVWQKYDKGIFHDYFLYILIVVYITPFTYDLPHSPATQRIVPEPAQRSLHITETGLN
jgi:hypothetical protein